MRRNLVEEAVKYCIENPPKYDLAMPLPERFDFTFEERELFSQLLKEESDKLTDWPEPVIM